MNFYLLRLILTTFFITFVSSNLYSRDLIKDLENTGNHNIFISIIENNPLFLSLINNKIRSTIFAPTDNAFGVMPDRFNDDIKRNNTQVTTKLILSHIFGGDTLNKNNNDKQSLVLSLDGSIYFTYELDDLFVKDIIIQGNPFISGNFRVIPVNCVMFLQPSSKDKRLDIKIRQKYSLTSCCLQTEVELKDFYKGLN